MFLPIDSALREVRDRAAGLLGPLALQDLCRSLGCRWRDRVLEPATTVRLFVLQILPHNTACSHLPRLTGRGFTASAYCQERSRLPLEALRALLRRLVDVCGLLTDADGLWWTKVSSALAS